MLSFILAAKFVISWPESSSGPNPPVPPRQPRLHLQGQGSSLCETTEPTSVCDSPNFTKLSRKYAQNFCSSVFNQNNFIIYLSLAMAVPVVDKSLTSQSQTRSGGTSMSPCTVNHYTELFQKIKF